MRGLQRPPQPYTGSTHGGGGAWGADRGESGGAYTQRAPLTPVEGLVAWQTAYFKRPFQF